MSLRSRLERLEARVKLPEPPPPSEKRECAFALLFRTLDELKRLVEREGPLPLGDPRVSEIIERSHPETGERSEEHTSELQSRQYLVCRLLLEKKKHT